MHDGYIFTLGIAGSAGGATAQGLDTLLAALPPVKRAAYLGAVLTSNGLPSLADPLAAPILADVADAEILLIVTPLIGGRLPPRLMALTQTVPPVERERIAALVTFGPGDVEPLRAWIRAAQAQICGELTWPESDDITPQNVAELTALARRAYTLAREHTPHALP